MLVSCLFLQLMFNHPHIQSDEAIQSTPASQWADTKLLTVEEAAIKYGISDANVKKLRKVYAELFE